MKTDMMIYNGKNKNLVKVVHSFAWNMLDKKERDAYVKLEGKVFEDFIGKEYRVPNLPMDCDKECEFTNDGKKWITGKIGAYDGTLDLRYYWKGYHFEDGRKEDTEDCWFIFARIKK